MKTFKDAAGTEWTVFEVRRGNDDTNNWAYLPRGFRSGWLCFESSAGKRRLSPVPDDWKALEAPELTEMLTRATAAGKPPRGASDGLNLESSAGEPEVRD